MSIKIHGHPQKEAYESFDEAITVSTQGHWPKQGQDPATTDPGELAHLHVDMTGLIYRECSPGDVLHFRFSVQLHHTQGRITQVEGGWPSVSESLGTLIWDETGTSTPPVMVGDPEGDKVWTGTMELAVDPRLTAWWFASVHAIAVMDNGDTLGVRPQFPVWLTQTLASGGTVRGEPTPMLNSRVVASDKARPDIKYGDTVAQYDGFIPIAPISTPWFVPLSFYSYGAATELPAALSQVRRDLDLHHHIPGTMLFNHETLNNPGNPLGVASFPIDPTGLTPGPHKWALLRIQSNPPDQISALVVTAFTVDPHATPSPPGVPVLPPIVVTPPPVDPPPPAETWHAIPAVIEQFGNQPRLRINGLELVIR